MTREEFVAQNIKCGGCVSNIEKGLMALNGVNSVEVDIASGCVVVAGEAVSRSDISAKLSEMGYPEVV